jgi:hypothetical protein
MQECKEHVVTNVGKRCGAVMYLFHRMHGSFSIAHTSVKNGAAHNPGWGGGGAFQTPCRVHWSYSECTVDDSDGSKARAPWARVSPMLSYHGCGLHSIRAGGGVEL